MKYKEQKTYNQVSNVLKSQSFLDGLPRSGKVPKCSGSLGNATKLRSTVDFIEDFYVDTDTGETLSKNKISAYDSINEARSLRFELQEASRNILFGFHGEKTPINKKGYKVFHRTCTCTRFRNGSTTQIVKSKTTGKASYTGLMTCANQKTCPVCSAKISERKGNEMRIAFNMARAKKLNISLLTLTAPHLASDSIESLYPKISKALQYFWAGRAAQDFKKKYGLIGHIRSFEIRYGSNGWHPHFHIVLFSEKSLPLTDRNKKGFISNNQTDEWNSILNRWQHCCVRAGLSSPNEYGMDIQSGSYAGEYISKYGSDDEILETRTGKKVTWDMADEMTKGNVKMGRKKSLSPWDILKASYSSKTKEENQNYKLLFLFYARALHGVSLIKWSRNLRKYFELGSELTDQEICDQEEDFTTFLCHITPGEWEYILKNKKRHLILQLAENGGAVAVARFLHSSQNYITFEEYFEQFKNRELLCEFDENNYTGWDSVQNEVVNNPFKSEFNENMFNINNVDYFEKLNDSIKYREKLFLFEKNNPDLVYFAKNIKNYLVN